MPYIKHADREKFYQDIFNISRNIESEGELNFVITSLIHHELIKKGKTYQNMNNLVGALECAKNEFIRVVMGPYEDYKKKTNGNISSLDLDN